MAGAISVAKRTAFFTIWRNASGCKDVPGDLLDRGGYYAAPASRVKVFRVGQTT